jgi:coproporphyrinogen III oxidase
VDDEEASFFHSQLKMTCDVFDLEYYRNFKKWADDYFFIPHRQETRGIGGIFFDRLTSSTDQEKSKNTILEFVLAVGRTFAPTYLQIVEKKKRVGYSIENKKWQAIRRSRYVEFNLLYDKGTKFGLDSDGRVESILMSMPPVAEWFYNYMPNEDSEESRTLSFLKKDIQWV